jgi:hypothetical protein
VSELTKARLPSGTTQDGIEAVARDISCPMSYTVDPRVGSPKKGRSAEERQHDRCHAKGQRTNANRSAEPAPTLVAADQIAIILIRYAKALAERRGEGRRAAQ